MRNKSRVKVGFSKVNITPDYAVPLAGDGRLRIHTSVLADCYATCVAFRDEKDERAIIVTLDLLHTTEDEPGFICTNMQRVIREAGFKDDNIILSATHCHSAPNVFGSEDVITKKYLPFLFDCVSRAAREALQDADTDTDIYVGSVKTENMTFVRRYFDADGGFVGVNWPNKNPPVRHETDADGEMGIVKFVREGKKDIIITNFGTHLTTVGFFDDNALSSDFNGYAREYIENTLGAEYAFFQGASGNTVPTSAIESENLYPTTKEYGVRLAKYVQDALPTLKQISSHVDIKYEREEFPVYCIKPESMPENVNVAVDIAEGFLTQQLSHRDATVQAREAGYANVYECMKYRGLLYWPRDFWPFRLVTITVGDLAFASAPYEMFCQNGIAIKNGSRAKRTFVITHANGGHGYIPSIDVYDRPGYENVTCTFERGSGERIQDKLIEMINKSYK